MADFLDNLSDTELVAFVDNMWAVINVAPGDFAATADQATELKAKNSAFSGELTEHISKQAAAKAQTQAKNSTRFDDVKIARFIVNQAKLNGVSDEKIAELGFPLGYSGDAPANATRPIGMCDTSQRLQHTLDFRDEARPESKRIPRGVLGAEIYCKIGSEPPTGLKECVFLSLDTRTPYVIEYEAEDAGKIVHYIIVWRFRDDSASPMSETVSATVTG